MCRTLFPRLQLCQNCVGCVGCIALAAHGPREELAARGVGVVRDPELRAELRLERDERRVAGEDARGHADHAPVRRCVLGEERRVRRCGHQPPHTGATGDPSRPGLEDCRHRTRNGAPSLQDLRWHFRRQSRRNRYNAYVLSLRSLIGRKAMISRQMLVDKQFQNLIRCTMMLKIPK